MYARTYAHGSVLCAWCVYAGCVCVVCVNVDVHVCLCAPGLPDACYLFEYLPMWRELVQPRDKVTRLLLHNVLESHSMACVLGRPLGASQAEIVMQVGLEDIKVASGQTDPLGPDADGDNRCVCVSVCACESCVCV